MSDMKRFSKREESLRGQLAERLPGIWGQAVKRSNRAYSAFLDHTRKVTLEDMIAQRDWSGAEGDTATAKKIAEFINNATGAGGLKFDLPGGHMLNLEQNANALRNVLWSPRLLASRAKFLNPYTYINADPMMRQEYIKGALRSASTWLTFAGLAKMGGADVSVDPTNADFGKIKIGDTRIDPGAGFQQMLVLAARLAPTKLGEMAGIKTGKFTSSATGKTQEYGKGFRPKDRASILEDFATSKLRPTHKLAWDLMKSSNDRPVHLADRAVQLALPIMAQDIMDAAKSDPGFAALIGPISSVGLGTSVYGKGDRLSDPVFTDSIEKMVGAPSQSLRGTVRGW
jgi:hypothetical protein